MAVALSLGSAAIEEGDGDAALPYLEWAKAHAGNVAPVREALGVARYLAGDFAGALRELQAYRRISGREDQNHVLADCHRALGRDLARVGELVQAMGDEAPEDRVTEGIIVWGSALADDGQFDAGRAVVNRRVQQLGVDEPDEQRLRLWYVAADLAARSGDPEAARSLYDRVLAVASDFFDTAERRRALS